MDENPYQAPKISESTPQRFLRLPNTVVEWIVVILVILMLTALILPDFPVYFDAPSPDLKRQ